MGFWRERCWWRVTGAHRSRSDGWWVADLDEFGTKIADKHKSDVGAFIPWKELGR